MQQQISIYSLAPSSSSHWVASARVNCQTSSPRKGQRGLIGDLITEISRNQKGRQIHDGEELKGFLVNLDSFFSSEQLLVHRLPG